MITEITDESRESGRLSAEDTNELEVMWNQLDLCEQILITSEVAVARLMRLALWKKAVIILFAAAVGFQIADWITGLQLRALAFGVGLMIGLAVGLVVRRL